MLGAAPSASPATASHKRAVDRQQDDRPQGCDQDGPDVEARYPRPAEEANDEAAHKGAHDPEDDRYYKTPRVVPWHEKLGPGNSERPQEDTRYYNQRFSNKTVHLQHPSQYFIS